MIENSIKAVSGRRMRDRCVNPSLSETRDNPSTVFISRCYAIGVADHGVRTVVSGIVGAMLDFAQPAGAGTRP